MAWKKVIWTIVLIPLIFLLLWVLYKILIQEAIFSIVSADTIIETATNTKVINSTSSVKEFVERMASVIGIPTSTADFIIRHESNYCQDKNGFNAEIVGDNGNSRGCWQINKVYHPEVTDECANSLFCSTHWSLNYIKNGYINEWSTWKYRNKWYK